MKSFISSNVIQLEHRVLQKSSWKHYSELQVTQQLGHKEGRS